jgi:hypothetical protein
LRFPKPAKRSPKPRKPVKRSVRPHAVRQTKRAAQERKLDRLWSQKVKERANGRCEACSVEATDAHHIFGRTRKSVRWTLTNGIALCRPDHRAAHKHRESFMEFVFRLLGPINFATLCEREQFRGRVDLDQAARELAG